MNRLSKDEIQRLSPEQQEAYGDMELQRIKKRCELLAKAGRSRIHWYVWLPAVAIFALGFSFWFHREAIPTFFWVVSLAFLIQFHALCLNQRLDALLELMESDSKSGDTSREDVPEGSDRE